MNPFDKILKSPQSTTNQSSGGYFDDIPVSKNGTSKPSKALSVAKDIGKAIVKLPLRAATNIDQALSGTNREIYSGKTFGDVKPIGTQTFDAGGIDLRNPKQGLTNTAKDLKDIAGASLETLSYLPFARAVTTGVKTGKVALGALAKEGAIGGGTGVAGQQIQQGGEFNPTDILKGVGFGAAAGPAFGVLGSGISKIFGGKRGIEVIADVPPPVMTKPVVQGITPTEIPTTVSSIIRDGKVAPELAQQATTFAPKLSTELEAMAIEKKFVDKFGDLPQVQTMNMKDESLKWADLVEKDYDAAKASVLNSQLPEGFNNSLGLGYEAVVRKATNDGDWQLLKELATNPNAAPTQASLIAQKLKSFDNNLMDSNDPIELMQSLSKARESVVDIKQKGVKRADVQTLDNAIKPKIVKEDWSSFIDSIPDC